jgi:LmbE family N-acetylglucosaminyl deacetylase
VSRIVAVTPQLSDAVLSVGATLARHVADGHDVMAVSVFGRQGREPDTRAADTLGLAGVVHLAVDPAPARGYDDDATAPYDGLHAGDDAPKVAGAVMAVALAQLQPDLILAPLGLSGHVDHLVVQSALDELGLPRLRWVDLPFALHRTPGATLGAGDVIVVPVAEHLETKLAAAGHYGADLERLARHAAEEGARRGLDGPAEVLVRRPAPDAP